MADRLTTAALVVTNRPAFIPWWTHQINKQTRKLDEVVVVDNRPDLSVPWFAGGAQGPLGNSDPSGPFYRAKHLPPQTSLGELRQAALEMATADIVLWFDDDDWYHPRRVELLAEPIEQGAADGAALPLTHRLYLETMLMFPMCDGVSIHLPATAWRRELVTGVRFPAIATGEDCVWLREVVGLPVDGNPAGKWRKPSVPYDRIRWRMEYQEPHIGGMVLIHGRNSWQGREPRQCTLDVVESKPLYRYPTRDVSREEWSTTLRLLEELRTALR